MEQEVCGVGYLVMMGGCGLDWVNDKRREVGDNKRNDGNFDDVRD